ncbi:hypothetical protein Adeh_4280 [Anaeromyxobacter dehalogenans 2CP-C]|uniref:Polysaccharide biosynthesis protein n=2 Tax=Anaeromyxobacter dehalogenans TaxID=161493 RepID=Q2IHI9_ANADE|nr:hypothetical protein Adeh_4280 [Anaeromyxobacter dehalogenans 2CP-C]
MLPLVTASVIFERHPAEFAVVGALAVGLIVSATVLYGARHSVRVAPVATDVGSVAVPFVLSLGLMALLNTVDRFTLEKIHSPTVFAEYVYAVTILSTPFTILSSYFGFKEAVRYRKQYSRNGVRKDALRTVAISALQVIAWSVACYLTRQLSGLTFDLSLWILLGILSAVRCGYGILSAAMGIRGTASAIYWSNSITAISLAAFGFTAILLRVPVIAVVAGYVLVWVLRFVAYFVFLTESADVMRSANAEGEAA